MALPKGAASKVLRDAIDAATAKGAANTTAAATAQTAADLANTNLGTLKVVAAPANAAATGTTGQIARDTGFIYICTATNTWKRVAVATW